jgi:hypothetical protein
VPFDSVTDSEKYQFWDGSSWTSTHLVDSTYNSLQHAAVFEKAAAGSMHYNQYYKKYIYLYPGPPLSAGKLMFLLVRTRISIYRNLWIMTDDLQR